jgi:hypothetical protein
LGPIRAREEFGANVSEVREVQDEKQESPSERTDAGIATEASEEQPENVCTSICSKLEESAKATEESEVHCENADLQIVSTEAGMQIDSSAQQPEKAWPSIRTKCDGDSNETDAREVSFPETKHSWPMNSTEAGIVMEAREGHSKKQRSSIRRTLDDENMTFCRQRQ